jgi:hypothetical protein
MARIGSGRRGSLPAIIFAALALACALAGCGAPNPAASQRRPATSQPETMNSRPETLVSRHGAGHGRTATSGLSAAGLPRYFADIVRVSGSVAGAGPLQIRSSATGALVPQQPVIEALAIAAYDSGSRLVVARQVDDRCDSRLYLATLSADGSLGRLTRLGPVIHGIVASVAADASASVIGYFAGTCVKPASGYLAVLTARTGLLRRWTGVSVSGSDGTVVTGTALSESADGRLLAFTGAATGAGGGITGQRVWVLRTSAASGPLALRIRAVISKPLTGPALSSVVLSPDGRSFYLCTVRTKGTASAHKTVTQTAVITAWQTSDGTSTSKLAKLTATGVTFGGEGFGCPMALTPNGRYLLAPYQLRYGNSATVPPLVRAAVIRTSTHARRAMSFQLPGSAGMSVADGISVAW